MGYLASYLRRKNYKDISIYSSIFDSDRKIIKEASAVDIVGITAVSPMIFHAEFLANKIKKNNPKVTIVLGGIHASALPEESLDNKSIDFVVRGEGEVTFYELLEAIQCRKDVEDVAGISFRKNGGVYYTRNRALIPELDAIPYPARDLFNQDGYLRRYSRIWGVRSATVLSSRGCPFECSFCAAHCIWTRMWRVRSPENIIGEVEELISRYKIEEINFTDATFTIDRKRVLDFCNLLRKENFNISWQCNAHPATINREMLESMKAAGCKMISLGVESGSPKILKEMKKGVSIEKVEEVFRIAREVGIKTFAFFMIGYPSDDFETIKETERLISEIKPDYTGFTILIPFPGSELYQVAKEADCLDFDWARVDYDKATIPTKSLSLEDLNKEYRRLTKKTAYLWKNRRLSIWYIIIKGITELKCTSFSEFGFLVFKIWRYCKFNIKSKIRGESVH